MLKPMRLAIGALAKRSLVFSEDMLGFQDDRKMALGIDTRGRITIENSFDNRRNSVTATKKAIPRTATGYPWIPRLASA
jgi:hypothetical protein